MNTGRAATTQQLPAESALYLAWGQTGVAAHYYINQGLACSVPVQLLTGLVCAAGAEPEQAGVPLCWGVDARQLSAVA